MQRKEPVEKTRITKTIRKNKQEEWLEKLEQTLARMKQEVDEKKKAKEQYEARREK